MMASPLVKFKDKGTAGEFDLIDHRLQIILDEAARFTNAAGYEFVVTDLLSSVSDDKRLGRVSSSHHEGRAADVRVRGWPEEFITKLTAWLERVYGHHGAVSKSDGKRRLVVRHTAVSPTGQSLGDHFHIQVGRKS